MSAPTEAMIGKAIGDIAKIEEAHTNIDILLKAVSYIAEKTADFQRHQDGACRYSPLASIDLALGLACIAGEYLDRADDARAAADDALFVKPDEAA